MSKLIPIAYAMGDGIGPEIMTAVKNILDAADAPLEWREVILGEQAFKAGVMNGVGEGAWDIIRDTKVLFKAPLTTPQGGGYKSVNVTMRKGLGLFANLRQVKTFEPILSSSKEGVDMVIVRENEEDLYAGIEYKHTPETVQALKLITHKGTQQIIRYAFDYAVAHGRKKVTLMVKDNIMKQVDGLYAKYFAEIAKEYPQIEHDTYIVDIGMARVADTPEWFDVLVTQNLYGDIVSDIASQVCGSVGLAGSANIGRDAAMFEAVHGSAPDIAGQNKANPSGLLNAGVLMLRHLGLGEHAAKIENAWLSALEDKQWTLDLKPHGKYLNTDEFAQAVIDRLGQNPCTLTAAKEGAVPQVPVADIADAPKPAQQRIGVDVFVHAAGTSSQTLGDQLAAAATDALPLSAISSRGMKVYPGPDKPGRADQWRCRFMPEATTQIELSDIRELLAALEGAAVVWDKIETLHTFDGATGFSIIQGD